MTPLRLLAAGALAAAAAAVAVPGVLRRTADPATGEGEGPLALVVVSLPAGAPGGSPGRLPAGCRLLRLDPGGAGRTVDLAPGFAAAGSPRVSFDGGRVLFAGRRTPGEDDGIWVVAARGGAPAPVASVAGGCADPAWLPGGRVVFSAPAPGFGGRNGAPVRSLFAVAEGGGEPERVTFRDRGSDGEPEVLADGRILFVAAGGPRPGTDLLAVHDDGTGVHPFHGPLAGPGERRRPRETGDRGVVFVDDEGRIRRLDARDPARSAPELAPGVAGVFRAAEPLPGGGLLVALRPAAGRPTWGIHRLSRVRPGAVETVLDDPDRDEVEAVVLVPRAVPQGHLSLVEPEKATGRILCLDARRGFGLPADGPAPAAVRIRESLPAGDPAGYDGRVANRLGTVTLAADGSFYAEVPADRPLEVELLADDGTVLASSGPSFWVRPNETRACIGCHEDPAVAPRNALPAAVLGDPAPLARPDRAWRSR